MVIKLGFEQPLQVIQMGGITLANGNSQQRFEQFEQAAKFRRGRAVIFVPPGTGSNR